MPVRVHAVGRDDLAPLLMSDRFRTEIAYFMSLSGDLGVPKLGPNEFWIDLARAREWLDDGVFHLVSPLDSAVQAEIELTEEQESWLEWMLAHEVQHVRLG